MSWITEMRNPLRVAATYNGMVGTRVGRAAGYVHSGVDIGVVTGTQVFSARTGTVAYAGYYPGGYGNFVVIDHGNGVYSAYAHLDSIATLNLNGTVRALQERDSVTSNTLLGLSGNTGEWRATSSATDPRNAYAPHLHFEIRRINGVVVTQTDTAGIARPVIIDETGAQTGWSTSGETYRQQLRNPDGPGGQTLYNPAEVVRLYGAEMSEGAAFVQERFLRINDPYGGRDPVGMGRQQWPPEHVPSTPYCFAAGTQVLMADGSERAIEQVAPGDMVASFDGSVDRWYRAASYAVSASRPLSFPSSTCGSRRDTASLQAKGRSKGST